jgi:YD repeat-containing protein
MPISSRGARSVLAADRLAPARSVQILGVLVLALFALAALAAPAAVAAGKASSAFAALTEPSLGAEADVSTKRAALAPEGGRKCRPDRLNEACERAVRRADALLEQSSGTQAMSAEASAAGNSLSVSAVGPAFQSVQFIADFHNGDDFFTCNPGGTYYPEEIYAPCAQIDFSDAVSGSATSNNNRATAVVYDACGNVAGGSTTYGWYRVGDPEGRLISGGNAGGLSEWISPATPPSCAGLWTVVYEFRQTFTDGETLTASASGTFVVKPVQILSADETRGGGNPAELPCQGCVADPVNTASGDYFDSTTDLSFGGRGPGLRMDRTYSSLAAASGQSSPLGRGWSFGYGMSLAIDAGTGRATITNGNGSQTVFAREGSTYVAPGRVLATLVRNTDGSHTYTVRARAIYTFNSTGKLVSIADLNGNKITLAYDTSGRLRTATDGASRTLTYSYGASGRLAGVSDSTGRQVTYTHDSAGNLTAVTDVRGGVWGFTYDDAHLLSTRRDANGNVVMTNTYDGSGRTLTQTDGLGNKTTVAYTGSPSTTTRVTDPKGRVTEYEYKNGLLTRVTRAVGTTQAATWRYAYDVRYSLGLTQVTDPYGKTSSFTYDLRGNRTSYTDTLGKRSSAAYDSLNNSTSLTDAAGVTTTFTYDSKGNLLSRSTPLTGTAQSQTFLYTYSKTRPGDIASLKDPLGNTTAFTYDAAAYLSPENLPGRHSKRRG